MAARGDAESVARDNEPPCPPELHEALQFEDGPEEPSHAPRCNDRPYWSRDILAACAKPGSTSSACDKTTTDSEMIVRLRDLPVPEATRARCRELLAVYDRWQVEIEATEIDFRALETLSEEQSDRCHETIEEILGLEPQTVAGLVALARLALDCDMLDGGTSEVYSAVQRTTVEGLVRLGGGRVS